MSSGQSTKMHVAEAIANFRLIVQHVMALHIKRQRDHIVRLRRHFFTKLARRLHQNYLLYCRKRRQLEEDVVALTVVRAPRQRKPSHERSLLNRFTRELASNTFAIEQINMVRMGAETFGYLCETLREELLPGRAPQTIDAPLTLEMKIAIALYVLGSGADYRQAASTFGVHFSTVRKCVHGFCQAMVKTFAESEIHLPTDAASLDAVVKEFEAFVGIPQCVGIIDCLHVAINLPPCEPTQYINSKGWSSLVLQAVVDRHGRFTHISCTQGGKSSDEAVLLHSPLYPKIDERVYPFDQAKSIDGKDVYPFLLGDKGYPLLSWLITPHSAGGRRSSAEYSFNVYMAKARNVIGTTFERLTGRWKILDRCLHTQISAVPDIVTACCILHNITERRESPYMDSWSYCPNVDDTTPTQPQWSCEIGTTEGEKVRNHLVKYMFDNFPSIEEDDN